MSITPSPSLLVRRCHLLMRTGMNEATVVRERLGHLDAAGLNVHLAAALDHLMEAATRVAGIPMQKMENTRNGDLALDWVLLVQALVDRGARVAPEHPSLPEAARRRFATRFLLCLAKAGCDPMRPLAEGGTPFDTAMSYTNPVRERSLAEWSIVGVPFSDPGVRDRTAQALVDNSARRECPRALASLATQCTVDWTLPTEKGELGAVFRTGLVKMEPKTAIERAWRAQWTSRLDEEYRRCKLARSLAVDLPASTAPARSRF